MNTRTWILLCAIIIGGLTLTALSVYAVIMEITALLGTIMLLMTTMSAVMLYHHLRTTKTQKEKKDNKLVWLLILATIVGIMASTFNIIFSF